MGASSPHVFSYVKNFNEKCKKIISEQRYIINVFLQKKMSNKDIAKAIIVDLSTIYRELKRNSGSRNHYNWETAEANARRKKRRTPGNRRISQEVNGQKINRYTPSEDQSNKSGNKGKKVGIAYQLENGEIIYVPEDK